MNALQKRFALFLGGCIPARLFLVYLAKTIPLKYLPYMGLGGLLLAGGFIYLFITGKRSIGLETGGAPIWWKNFRLLHGLLYLLFAIFALKGEQKIAYKLLLVDVFLGLGLFLWHHYNAGSFSQLF